MLTPKYILLNVLTLRIESVKSLHQQHLTNWRMKMNKLDAQLFPYCITNEHSDVLGMFRFSESAFTACNAMNFKNKILYLQHNGHILTLASDGNCWGVRVKDTKIQEQLEDCECNFTITQEWDCHEMFDSISILKIGNTDL